MDDTGQPAMAPETEPISLQDLANTFKAFDANPAQGDEPVVPRQADGRFAPRTPPPEADTQIEAPEEADEAEAGAADAQDEDTDTETDAEEGATDEVPPLPQSWSPEKTAIWEGLPPEAQAYIAQRDGEMKSLLTVRTQETANARKAAEAIQAQAQAHRDNAMAITEAAMQLL